MAIPSAGISVWFICLELADAGRELEVQVMDKRVKAKVANLPLVDPKGEKEVATMTIRGLHPGLNQTAGIGLKMFSDDELEKIHLATLDVLWNVGLRVESPEAVEIFHGSGCWIGQDARTVKIPAHLVEDAIRTCPPTFRACGRDAAKDFLCDRDRVGFVNFGEAPA